MLDILWDLKQSADINAAQGAADRGERKALDAVGRVQELEDRINKLTLINMAMWSLMTQITTLTEEDLQRRVQEIDLSDGMLDGKVRGGIQQCPQCKQTLSQRHNRCLYCGFEPEAKTAFDQVAR